MIYNKINGKYEEMSLENQEGIEIQLISISLFQRDRVYIEWEFEILSQKLFCKATYSAWANKELTRNNFSVVGISAAMLPSVIFNPRSIKGIKLIADITGEEIYFRELLSSDKIIIPEIEIPF